MMLGAPTSGTLLSIIFKDNRWFMLKDTVIYELHWNNAPGSGSYGFMQIATMVSFTSKMYSFVSGSLFDLVYVPGEPFIYELGYCHGNTQYNGSACVSYSCTDLNCMACWILPNLCGTCLTNFPRTDHFYCSILPTCGRQFLLGSSI